MKSVSHFFLLIILVLLVLIAGCSSRRSVLRLSEPPGNTRILQSALTTIGDFTVRNENPELLSQVSIRLDGPHFSEAEKEEQFVELTFSGIGIEESYYAAFDITFPSSKYSPVKLENSGLFGREQEVLAFSPTEIRGHFPVGIARIRPDEKGYVKGSGGIMKAIFKIGPQDDYREPKRAPEPLGTKNDIVVVLTPTGLQWNEARWGDWNNDGIVSASDIAPLASFFGRSSDPLSPDYYMYASAIDGNEDGLVNAGDLAPVALGFGVSTAGYTIYEADDEVGTNSTAVAKITRPSPPQDTGNPPLNISLDSISYDTSAGTVEPLGWVPVKKKFYQVVPFDTSTPALESQNLRSAPFKYLPPAKWTFLVFIAADNDLASYALTDINEMEVVGSTDDVNIVVGADVYYSDFLGPYELIWQGSPVAAWFRVKNDQFLNQIDLSDPDAVIIPRRGYNSASVDTLKGFLTWAKDTYPAERYALVLWSHGNSWHPGGPILPFSPLFNGGELGEPLRDPLQTSPDKSPSDILYDYSEAFSLSTWDIAQAIAETGLHIDLLDFDSCLMGTLEICYDFAPVASYAIVSQALVPGDGNDYTTLLQYLTGNPDATAVDLGTAILQSYLDYYQGGFSGVQKSLIDLSLVQPITDKVKELVPYLLDPNVIGSTDLLNILRDTDGLFENADLTDFTTDLKSVVTDLALLQIATDTQTLLGNAIIANVEYIAEFNQGLSNFHGAVIIQPRPQDPDRPLSGLSLFLPDYYFDPPGYLSHYKTIPFDLPTGWSRVLERIFYGYSPEFNMVPASWEVRFQWADSADDLDLLIMEPADSTGRVNVTNAFSSNPNWGIFSEESSFAGTSYEYYQSNNPMPDQTFYVVGMWYYSTAPVPATLEMKDTGTGATIYTSPVVTLDFNQPVDSSWGGGYAFFGGVTYGPTGWTFTTPDKYPASFVNGLQKAIRALPLHSAKQSRPK